MLEARDEAIFVSSCSCPSELGLNDLEISTGASSKGVALSVVSQVVLQLLGRVSFDKARSRLSLVHRVFWTSRDT